MASPTPAPTPDHRRLRRAGGALLTTLVALAGVVALLLFLQGRDRSEIDRGDSTATIGQPLDGRALPAALRGGRDTRPGDAQIVAWLERGNVVFFHGSAAAPRELSALARKLAGPFDPALAEAGQAVVLARRPGIDGVVALASRRILRTRSATDPQLERFASHWLGQPAR